MKRAEQEMTQFQSELMLDAERMRQEFALEMEKIKEGMDVEKERIKAMKEVSLAQSRLPALRDEIQDEGLARRYFTQTLMETFASDSSILSAEIEQRNGYTKVTVLRNSDYIAVSCPLCNRETFEVKLIPGRYTYRCHNKGYIFIPPEITIDIDDNLNVEVRRVI